MKYCFGIDIGGTTVKMGLFDESGTLLSKWQIKTRTEHQGEAILPDVANSVLKKQREFEIATDDILGIGVGVPAAVCEGGIVENTTNLGWGYKKVKCELQELTGYPIYVENDANLAALGELEKGAGQGCKDVVMVTLGTGVGGGIIINGRIVSGVKGGAGEIGEIYVDYEIQEEGARVPKNLEYYASATGINRLAKKKLARNTQKTVLDIDNVSAKDVFDAAKMDDVVAIEILSTFASYLGQALTNLAVTLAPEAFIIGGGVSSAGDILLEYVRQYYHAPNTRLVLAALGNDAGIYGASSLVLQRT